MRLGPRKRPLLTRAESSAPATLVITLRRMVKAPNSLGGWNGSRLRLWLEDETGVLATTSLDAVRRPASGGSEPD